MSDKKTKNPNSLANLKPIKKGQVLNPTGKGGHYSSLHKLMRLSRDQYVDVVNEIIRADYETIKAMNKDPKASIIKRMVVSVALGIIESSSPHDLEIFLNRLIGRIPDEIKVDGEIINKNENVKIVVMVPSNGRDQVKDVTPIEQIPAPEIKENGN